MHICLPSRGVPGDYNMTPDRHLGSAWMDRVRPDVLITETTYATTIRESRRVRERDFLKRVHECVEKGGKVCDGSTRKREREKKKKRKSVFV
jgi:predicted metal-dependent RNase